MVKYTCIRKIRDRYNNIVEYILKNNTEIINIKPIILKENIRNNKIHVLNLTLTKDNRLIDIKKNKKDIITEEINSIIYNNKHSVNGNNGNFYTKTNNDIEIYHGSRKGIMGDIKPESRVGTDFGNGFYTGDKQNQALAIIRNSGSAKLLYTLYFDKSVDNLKIYRFSNLELWTLFIAYNRDKIVNKESYSKLRNICNLICKHDIIIGKIADDSLFSAFNEFYDKNLTIKGLEYCISKANLGNQYVFKTQQACNILKYGNIRRYNTETDDIITVPLREEIKYVRETVIDEAKTKFRNQGEYIDQILERYK